MSRNPFEFLTNEDLSLLVEKADRGSFGKDERILEEGSRRQAIFLVRKGTVRIERMHSGKSIAYVSLGPGEIFGEMSFVENQGASASVFADSDVDVDVIEGHHVNALMASVPGFGTRFYQSLAVTLAHRLRATSMLIPPLMVDETPQAKRSPDAAATEQDRPDQLPASLLSEVQTFRREMLKADRSLKNREISDEEAQKWVSATCENINSALLRYVRQSPGLSKSIGAYVFRETFPFFMLSKRFDRLYTKPRGYAADCHTIDLLCGGEPDGTGRLGRFIDSWLMNLPFSRAFKGRRTLLENAIKDAVTQFKAVDSFMVTAISSGTAHELLKVCTGADYSKVKAVLLDADSEALNSAGKAAKDLQISERVTFLHENVMRLVLGKGTAKLEPQHMIYSPGLLDYVEDEFALRLLNWIFDRLRPGGTAILASFQDSNPDRPLMDHILDWRLFHRSADQIRDMFARSSFSSGKLEIKLDDTETQLFIILGKV
ncbi:MAG: cyclic nucleotide-binding domain-containing protein [Desulfomonile tiedjei]|uniref:Cyclic nucleotide-binding domain-containing protein n=1 Tax=Desulfomonile tiedjei TaxID=2358 RepID=A0A9D6V4G9_9BACT|nr:cyclic nucleotide-binding domain-containing protein [Desulfomonile tiedjei]